MEEDSFFDVKVFNPNDHVTFDSCDSCEKKYNSISTKTGLTKFGQQKVSDTAQKMKFSTKDFFSKCDQIRSFLLIW